MRTLFARYSSKRDNAGPFMRDADRWCFLIFLKSSVRFFHSAGLRAQVSEHVLSSDVSSVCVATKPSVEDAPELHRMNTSFSTNLFNGEVVKYFRNKVFSQFSPLALVIVFLLTTFKNAH